MNTTSQSESRGVAFVKVLLLVYGTVMSLWPLAGWIPLVVAGTAALCAGLGGRAAWQATLRTQVVLAASAITLAAMPWDRNRWAAACAKCTQYPFRLPKRNEPAGSSAPACRSLRV